MKEKFKKQKGITLVALVITIIVLLILAMVSISIVINQGIMKKSKDAADKYNEAVNNEQEELTFFERLFGKYNGGNTVEDNTVENNITGPDQLPEVIEEGAKLRIDGINYTILYVNNDGTVEIVADNAMGYLILGPSDEKAEGSNEFEKTVNSYNNAVTRLNEYCESLYKDENGNYKNSNIISVRSVGSNRNNPNADTEDKYTDSNISTWNCTYKGESVTVNNVGKVEDNNYEEDYNKMKELGIETWGNYYYLASRRVVANTDGVNFDVRYVNYGDLSSYYLWSATSDGNARACNNGRSVRPVLKMNISALSSN